MPPMHNEIRWKSIEFHYHHKNPLWPTLVILITICVASFALWQGNLLFFIFTLIAALLTLVWGHRHPRELQFAINDQGLWIGKKLYRYAHFASFALYEETLQLHFINRINFSMDIIIPREKTKSIRNRLLAFIPEVEYTESFVDALAHWLKF